MTIGFLMATCMFLFMGQTSNEMYVTTSDNGRYQLEVLKSVIADGVNDFHLLDTKTGKIYYKNNLSWKKRIS